MRRFPCPAAFTLVELLVVITIIVVLLALLAPAMEKAIYQAELAVCGSSLEAISTGITVYAMDHKRRYPYRPRITDQRTRADIQNVLSYNVPDDVTDDLRPRLRNYFSVQRVMQCPLTQRVDLEEDLENTVVFASYQMWFSWRYRYSGKVYPGMFKMGDRVEFLDDRFDVLASDIFANETNNVQASHPDYEGRTTNIVWQRKVTLGAELGDEGAGIRGTVSLWAGVAGTIDRQFVYVDGSVERFNGLRFQETQTMVRLPWNSNSAQFDEGKGTFLPRR